MIILAAIVLLAALTGAISSMSHQQSDVIERQTMDDQISRMITHVSVLGTALLQMVVAGENQSTLYDDLSLVKPGDAGFDTPPHNLKIYHPYGGGVQYMEASIPNTADAAATDFQINTDSIIIGVGETDAVVGDILFTATIASLEFCQAVNRKLTGSGDVPTMLLPNFNALFVTHTTTTVNNGACADCVNTPALCVTDGSGHWGFYASLMPG